MAAAKKKPAPVRPATPVAEQAVPVPLPGQPSALKFVTAMCADLRGRIWVGTEGDGVWCFDPRATASGDPKAAWMHFTRQSTGGTPETNGPVLTTGTPDVNALGDDCAYALACDKLGRIWVGHLNHGVSVYNGESWRNYDVLSGPLGERVFDISVCPVDGDMWMATSAGLARYSQKADAWSYVTRADGLPSDQVQAIAFSKNGTLYAGTQCDGIAICAPVAGGESLKYAAWKCVSGPDALPVASADTGLPGNLINDMLVAKDGTVYAATTTGLAWSRDGGVMWKFLRGADWLAKAKGLYVPPDKDRLEAAEKKAPATLLLEDYCTSVAEDASGTIWVGHWRTGYEAIRLQKDGTWKRLAQSAEKTYASRLLPPPGLTAEPDAATAPMLVGNYGEGLHPIGMEDVAGDAGQSRGTASGALPVLPSTAKPSMEAELDAMLRLLQGTAAATNSPSAVYLRDDWMTAGDWLARYGRAWTVLCATMAPLSLESGNEPGCAIDEATIGPNHSKGDVLRAWVEKLKVDNRNSLFMQILGIRREAEWDDHGEVYPYTHGGLGIRFKVKIPEGVYRLSLYFFNPNGHIGENRRRDYRVEIAQDGDLQREDTNIIAHARVCSFAGGGTYKQFMVDGGKTYTVCVQRNGSFNTILNGVFIDRISGHAPKKPFSGLGMMGVKYDPPKTDEKNEGNDVEAWRKLWDACSRVEPGKEAACLSRLHLYRMQAIRTAMEDKKMDHPLLQQYSWSLKLWTQPLRHEFDIITAKGFWHLQRANPELRTKKEAPHSPNTYATPKEWEKNNKVEPKWQ